MIRFFGSLVLASIVAVFGAGQAKADTLAGDFSPTSNPSGNWTYGQYTGGLNPATFQAFTHTFSTSVDGHSLDVWNNLSSPFGVDPNVIFNPGSTFTTSGFGNITFNSQEVTFGPYGGPTVAEWTATTAGTYVFNATFTPVQLGNGYPTAYVFGAGSQLVSLSAPGLSFWT